MSHLFRQFVQLNMAVWLLMAFCLGQEASSSSGRQKTQQDSRQESRLEKIRDLPAEWLIGPYVPSTHPLQPLSNQERTEIYVHQTFLNAGAYVARMFTAGIDQARGVPSEWGGGMPGYGRRFGSRYGQFVIANALQSVGNAALGYESRYDLCRCTGFWPRSRHAIVRNFVTYNRTERELRPAIPLYAGSFGAGMISSVWLPGPRNVWKEGAYSALIQAGIGSGVNWVSEFAIDILRRITNNRYPKEK
ncbi:MAG TPA: hypothetical protein VEV41_06080 [Terriglobales bacterium]|nr:hypothetical protein [Terriglobales bacterium]